MSLKETVIKLTCVLALLGCFVQTVAADWYDDLKPNGTWVEIEGENFVAETFLGVKALYNENNSNYQCGDLVIRFYKEAYGLDIYPYGSGGPSSETAGYKFVKTKSPKPGDIIYVSAEMRNSSVDHWAIVREYSDGYITMFEQNARYNGQAAVGRKIKFPSDSYYIYTPVSTGDAPAPVLKNAATGEAAEPTATQAATTEKVTDEPTTQKPTTTVPTTAKPTTTAPTTVRATETKPTTTKPVTTTQAATLTESVPETTTDVSLTVTEEVTTAASSTAKQTEAQTQAVPDEKEPDNNSKYFVYAVAGAAVAVGASAMLIIKKRKK